MHVWRIGGEGCKSIYMRALKPPEKEISEEKSRCSLWLTENRSELERTDDPLYGIFSPELVHIF